MEHLCKVIGDVPNLVICTDACKGLETAVGAVFPQAENRECMRHLYQNFMKHYSGEVITDHLYPAARSYTQGMFEWHMKKGTPKKKKTPIKKKKKKAAANPPTTVLSTIKKLMFPN